MIPSDADDYITVPDTTAPSIDDVIARYEEQYIARAESEGLLWALKMSDVGQALVAIWRDEIEHYDRHLRKTKPDDALTITKLQSLIYTRERWVSRIESAQETDAVDEPRTEES